MNKILSLIICLSIPLGLGAIAGYVTSQQIPLWYSRLNKPSFNPPNWIFAPVWTSLYILLGLSLFLVLQKAKVYARTKTIRLFAIQMFLNFSWSFSFFYFHQTTLAFINIALLWVSILLMIRHFYTISKTAGLINLPYLLWVSFASLLNFNIWYLN